MSQPFYITTPIYYVNDIPHVGHAYTTLAADTLARWHQLLGEQTYFLTGTDEHGLKIEQAARKSGISPQAHVDQYSEPFRQLCQTIDAQPNDFIRTTEPRHMAFVQELWERMKDDIYLGEYSGWYSVGDEAFFTEEELINGKAPSGHDVSWVTEKSYFFRLSKYTEPLLAYFDQNPDFIKPDNRFNEIKSFVKQGLRDLSISRTTFSWGIPVPNDPKHVIYVWVDALSNYISALGGVNSERYQQFWPSATHLIGKDILRFHCVFWPCFLMSAGLPLPKQVFAHGWWTNEGEKMSKTKGNTIDPELVVKAIGPDAFRYFVLREIPFGSDGDFSQAALLSRVNHELGNDFGNLFNRTLAMLNKYRASRIPDISHLDPSVYHGAEEKELYQTFSESRIELIDAMKDFRFHDALKAIWKLISYGNRYITMKAPWVLAKQNQNEALDVVLYNLCELLRITAVWNQPFLPQKSQLLLDGLGVTQAELKDFKSTLRFGLLPAKQEVIKELVLFPRVEGPLILSRAQQNQTNSNTVKTDPKGNQMSSPQEAQNPKPETSTTPVTTVTTAVANVSTEPQMIDIDHFAKIELKVAIVLSAEKVEKADKLLKLTLDAGEAQPRTVLSGIAQHYSPESMVGKRVVLLANLKPRKIRGIESHGMLLAGSHENTVKLLDISSDLPAGSTIG